MGPLAIQRGSSAFELFPAETFLGVEVERMKSANAEERGAIFTRREVVHFILNLTGYTPDKPLWQFRLLEPSFGSGDFLIPVVERLLITAARHGKSSRDLLDSIRAIELHRETFHSTLSEVLSLLVNAGFSLSDASVLADTWLCNGDFLLESIPGSFDFVVGNPPYVRQEMIPAGLLAEYRRRYATLYDRADLYIPFLERSLKLLWTNGYHGFICSDRWMKNRYGSPLRRMIADGYSLKYYVDMFGTPAFHSEVVAYPAITVIQRAPAGNLRIAHRPEVSTESLARLYHQLTGASENCNGPVTEMSCIADGESPWLLAADAQPSLSLVRRLESEFATLEEAGCAVGIGVATGADKVFIGPMKELDVEDSRKLPLVMTRDILDGTVNWRGLGVINPFEEDGTLADFSRYPRFAAFMESHAVKLKARHCAKRANGNWYRTIDRITPSLARRAKLLIPDIKGDAHIVLEEGGLYPHHNLYHITSGEWPLAELRAVLMAGIAGLFVRAYSTKMHGGCLRFQAQYLRRIRIPSWNKVPEKIRRQLSAAVASDDKSAVLTSVCQLYRLTPEEMQQLAPKECSCL
jgi:hypothetical protein